MPQSPEIAAKLTNSLLCTTIYERLDRPRVHFYRNTSVRVLGTLSSSMAAYDSLKHRHPSKRLRRVLQRMLHVLHDRLLPDRLLDFALRLDVVWVRVQTRDLALLCHLRSVVPLARLAQQFHEARRVRLRGLCELRLRLTCRAGSGISNIDEGRAGRTHRSQLGHEPRVAQQLQAHHLRVLLDRSVHESHHTRSARSARVGWGSAHLPPTLAILRRRRSIALSPCTPSCRIVAFGSCSSRPSCEMLCSLTGIEDCGAE